MGACFLLREKSERNSKKIQSYFFRERKRYSPRECRNFPVRIAGCTNRQRDRYFQTNFGKKVTGLRQLSYRNRLFLSVSLYHQRSAERHQKEIREQSSFYDREYC